MIEFNPKGNSILDQELSVSGLEMNILPFITAAATVIGVGASIFGQQSAAAAQQASANRSFQIASADRKHQIKVAEATNEYNDKLDINDRANYELERDFAFKSLMKDWRFGNQIQDFEHLSRMQEFKRSRSLTRKQGRLNKRAEKYAIRQEKAALRDAKLQQSFARETSLAALQGAVFEGMLSKKQVGLKIQGIKNRKAFGSAAIQEDINTMMTQGSIEKESAMVEGLVAQGQAELGQAGKSTQKGKQSSAAALHRSLRSLDNQLSGKYKQAATQLAELQADSSLALTGAQLDLVGINQRINAAQEEFDFNNRVIDANIKSAIKATKRNIRDIKLDRKFADLNLEANRMLKPSKLPYQPKPMLPPERIFLDRMEVIVPKKLKKGGGGGKSSLQRALESGDVVRKPESGEEEDNLPRDNRYDPDRADYLDDRFTDD